MNPSKSVLTTLRSQLRQICDAYLQQVRAMPYRDLCEKQDAPWASVGYGAGGIATVLLRARDAGDNLAFAQRWLSDAKRGMRARSGWWIPTFGDRPIETSLYHGPDGIHLLELVAACRDGEVGKENAGAALRSFLARCRRRRGGQRELVSGIAGTLTALVLLYGVIREPSVLRVANELAGELLSGLGQPSGWAEGANLYFAHGRAGTFHALLEWSRASGRDLPTEVFRRLARLADAADHAVTPRNVPAGDARMLARSWCNGAAGLVLLWARAYDCTGEATYLRLARSAARPLMRRTAGAPAHLCCGLGGRAYALLAMDRIEPERGWYERALEMTGAAMGVMLRERGPWPNGLFTGYPGLVCLSRDVLAQPKRRIGFPLVEGI